MGVSDACARRSRIPRFQFRFFIINYNWYAYHIRCQLYGDDDTRTNKNEHIDCEFEEEMERDRKREDRCSFP